MVAPDRLTQIFLEIVRGRPAVRRTYNDPNLRGQPKVAGRFALLAVINGDGPGKDDLRFDGSVGAAGRRAASAPRGRGAPPVGQAELDLRSRAGAQNALPPRRAPHPLHARDAGRVARGERGRLMGRVTVPAVTGVALRGR